MTGRRGCLLLLGMYVLVMAALFGTAVAVLVVTA